MKHKIYIAFIIIIGLIAGISVMQCSDVTDDNVDLQSIKSTMKSALLSQVANAGVLVSQEASLSFPNETSRQLSTYKLVVPTVARSTALHFAQRLGFDNIIPDAVDEDEIAFVIRENEDRRWMFMVWKASGAELAIDRDNYHSRPSSSPLGVKRWSLSDEQIKKIARDFIDEYAGVDMNEVVFDRFRRFNLSVGKSDGTWHDDYIVDVEVVFRRNTNGIPVIGQGSRIKVTVDVDGNVRGYYKVWREIDDLGTTVETVSSDVAVSEFLTMTSDIQATRPNVAIRNAGFGYYAGGPHNVQRYLLPAHSISYNSRVTDADDLTDGNMGKVFLRKGYNGADIEELGGVLHPELDAFLNR